MTIDVSFVYTLPHLVSLVDLVCYVEDLAREILLKSGAHPDSLFPAPSQAAPATIRRNSSPWPSTDFVPSHAFPQQRQHQRHRELSLPTDGSFSNLPNNVANVPSSLVHSTPTSVQGTYPSRGSSPANIPSSNNAHHHDAMSLLAEQMRVSHNIVEHRKQLRAAEQRVRQEAEAAALLRQRQEQEQKRRREADAAAAAEKRRLLEQQQQKEREEAARRAACAAALEEQQRRRQQEAEEAVRKQLEQHRQQQAAANAAATQSVVKGEKVDTHASTWRRAAPQSKLAALFAQARQSNMLASVPQFGNALQEQINTQRAANGDMTSSNASADLLKAILMEQNRRSSLPRDNPSQLQRGQHARDVVANSPIPPSSSFFPPNNSHQTSSRSSTHASANHLQPASRDPSSVIASLLGSPSVPHAASNRPVPMSPSRPSSRTGDVNAIFETLFKRSGHGQRAHSQASNLDQQLSELLATRQSTLSPIVANARAAPPNGSARNYPKHSSPTPLSDSQRLEQFLIHQASNTSNPYPTSRREAILNFLTSELSNGNLAPQELIRMVIKYSSNDAEYPNSAARPAATQSPGQDALQKLLEDIKRRDSRRTLNGDAQSAAAAIAEHKRRDEERKILEAMQLFCPPQNDSQSPRNNSAPSQQSFSNPSSQRQFFSNTGIPPRIPSSTVQPAPNSQRRGSNAQFNSQAHSHPFSSSSQAPLTNSTSAVLPTNAMSSSSSNTPHTQASSNLGQKPMNLTLSPRINASGNTSTLSPRLKTLQNDANTLSPTITAQLQSLTTRSPSSQRPRSNSLQPTSTSLRLPMSAAGARRSSLFTPLPPSQATAPAATHSRTLANASPRRTDTSPSLRNFESLASSCSPAPSLSSSTSSQETVTTGNCLAPSSNAALEIPLDFSLKSETTPVRSSLSPLKIEDDQPSISLSGTPSLSSIKENRAENDVDASSSTPPIDGFLATSNEDADFLASLTCDDQSAKIGELPTPTAMASPFGADESASSSNATDMDVVANSKYDFKVFSNQKTSLVNPGESIPMNKSEMDESNEAPKEPKVEKFEEEPTNSAPADLTVKLPSPRSSSIGSQVSTPNSECSSSPMRRSKSRRSSTSSSKSPKAPKRRKNSIKKEPPGKKPKARRKRAPRARPNFHRTIIPGVSCMGGKVNLLSKRWRLPSRSVEDFAAPVSSPRARKKSRGRHDADVTEGTSKTHYRGELRSDIRMLERVLPLQKHLDPSEEKIPEEIKYLSKKQLSSLPHDKLVDAVMKRQTNVDTLWVLTARSDRRKAKKLRDEERNKEGGGTGGHKDQLLLKRSKRVCQNCFFSKAACDSLRPCGRCKRLDKKDCVDRVLTHRGARHFS